MTSAYYTKFQNRGVLAITGPDRKAFLQKLITQDIETVAPLQPRYSLLLTPQGRILHDFFIYELPGEETLFLETEADKLPVLQQRLSAYKLRSQVSFADRSADFCIYAVWQDKKEIRIEKTPIPENLAIYDPRLPELGYRLFLPVAENPQFAERENVSVDHYEQWRASLGVAEGCQDLEQNLPAEFNLDGLQAISYKKGCYVGQEMTARLYFRALLKRRLFAVEGDKPGEAKAAIILKNGRQAGEMIRANNLYGLALLSFDFLASLTFENAGPAEEDTRRASMDTNSGTMIVVLNKWQQRLLPENILGKI